MQAVCSTVCDVNDLWRRGGIVLCEMACFETEGGGGLAPYAAEQRKGIAHFVLFFAGLFVRRAAPPLCVIGISPADKRRNLRCKKETDME